MNSYLDTTDPDLSVFAIQDQKKSYASVMSIYLANTEYPPLLNLYLDTMTHIYQSLLFKIEKSYACVSIRLFSDFSAVKYFVKTDVYIFLLHTPSVELIFRYN